MSNFSDLFVFLQSECRLDGILMPVESLNSLPDIALVSTVIAVSTPCYAGLHFLQSSSIKDSNLLFLKEQLTKKDRYRTDIFNGIVHPKRKILPSFAHPHVISNLHEFLFSAELEGILNNVGNQTTLVPSDFHRMNKITF